MSAMAGEAPFGFVKADFPLGPHTYYHVGGPARRAFFPETAAEAQAAFEWIIQQTDPYLVLGAGSNVLIPDDGFSGNVLFTQKLRELRALGDHRYYAGAGISLQVLVREVLLPNNYEGVNALAGIPGSVGGAIFMNAGTVNGSICQWLESVDLLSGEEFRTVAISSKLYGYRHQDFCAAGELILGGVFRFCVSDQDQRAIHAHYLQRRKETQPQGFCCGSVFKNPPGEHAARLIEACGLKGTRRGGAVISEKHANFIMNDNHATFNDILQLIELAKASVQAHFGIELEEEVRIIR
ncbi:MAG TPA: UDP-N-acetylmuramate dehydrogenase [Candidatus Hydrogenedentes bacterium]|nr:UDP-N-acetylmuramate dehydrogenase [Candidatus Hydrogenedentota bacterium]